MSLLLLKEERSRGSMASPLWSQPKKESSQAEKQNGSSPGSLDASRVEFTDAAAGDGELVGPGDILGRLFRFRMPGTLPTLDSL